MKTFNKFIHPFASICCLLLILSSCVESTEIHINEEESAKNEEATDVLADSVKTPTNIIFLIGDGMGTSQVSAAYFYGEEGTPPNFSRFPILGLINTTSGSDRITDSGAGATAFSIGRKSYNGAIGVDMKGEAVLTVNELLEAQGWQSGVISTSGITHATPASFYAHVAKRSQQYDIAKDLVYSNISFFAGGGQKWFVNRPDSLNYMDSLTHYGFSIGMKSLGSADHSQRVGYLLANDGLLAKHEGRDDFLPNATYESLEYFDQSEEPFFLMVEGSQIDWGGHENNGDYVIQEVLDFDKTIGVALDYAEKHGNTLVVVTADHETGGFSLSGDGKSMSGYGEISPTFSTGGHTATLIPVFAYGPGANYFGGVYENTAIFSKFFEALGQ
ncbi:MAG TPA: alkaline phosphatase [Opitutae bacterium]|nr:alkaline phosphatase [Opitutae bacterium]